MRPNSIVRFEQLFLGSLVLTAINIILNWDVWQMVGAHSDDAATYFIIIFPFVINLLLWYKIARKPSVIAKWLLIVVFLVGVVWSLATTDNYRFIGLVILFVTVCLKGGAIYMLFRRDSKQWFAGGNAAT